MLCIGLVAQLVEHVTFNDGVPRSSRGKITKTQITPKSRGDAKRSAEPTPRQDKKRPVQGRFGCYTFSTSR